MGQIVIQQSGPGFELRHFEDAGREDLALYSNPVEARAISTYSDAGEFRPLKTAPTLRHGWRLQLPDLESLRTALDFFYPAMLGSLLSHERNELLPVDLRETLGRQSGMYAVTKKITDPQADALIETVCNSAHGCLKTILWQIAPDRPVTSLPAEKFNPAVSQIPAALPVLPMLCAEACNLLVAAAREVVKKVPVAE
ncbi:MAG: hypothetical protein JWL90_3205 [Chthoniobacteraceae bacterium]|nr:hypothetical protein [Chthoniobacteraceae bacterium]